MTIKFPIYSKSIFIASLVILVTKILGLVTILVRLIAKPKSSLWQV